MKKITLCLLLIFSALTFLPLASGAAVNENRPVLITSEYARSTEARLLQLRLNEINQMDKSHIDPVKREKLRKEVLAIQHKLNLPGGGVYVSVGSIIIIAILLIILL